MNSLVAQPSLVKCEVLGSKPYITLVEGFFPCVPFKFKPPWLFRTDLDSQIGRTARSNLT